MPLPSGRRVESSFRDQPSAIEMKTCSEHCSGLENTTSGRPSSSISTSRQPALRPWEFDDHRAAGQRKGQFLPRALLGQPLEHAPLPWVADDQLADAVAIQVAHPYALVAAALTGCQWPAAQFQAGQALRIGPPALAVKMPKSAGFLVAHEQACPAAVLEHPETDARFPPVATAVDADDLDGEVSNDPLPLFGGPDAGLAPLFVPDDRVHVPVVIHVEMRTPLSCPLAARSGCPPSMLAVNRS